MFPAKSTSTNSSGDKIKRPLNFVALLESSYFFLTNLSLSLLNWIKGGMDMPKADASGQEGYTPKPELQGDPRKALEKFSKSEVKRVAEEDRSLGSAMRIYLERVQAGDLNNAVDALQQIKDGIAQFAPEEMAKYFAGTLVRGVVELYSESQEKIEGFDAIANVTGKFRTGSGWGVGSESLAKSIISPDAQPWDKSQREKFIVKLDESGIFGSKASSMGGRGFVRAWGDANAALKGQEMVRQKIVRPKTPPKAPPVK